MRKNQAVSAHEDLAWVKACYPHETPDCAGNSYIETSGISISAIPQADMVFSHGPSNPGSSSGVVNCTHAREAHVHPRWCDQVRTTSP